MPHKGSWLKLLGFVFPILFLKRHQDDSYQKVLTHQLCARNACMSVLCRWSRLLNKNILNLLLLYVPVVLSIAGSIFLQTKPYWYDIKKTFSFFCNWQDVLDVISGLDLLVKLKSSYVAVMVSFFSPLKAMFLFTQWSMKMHLFIFSRKKSLCRT